MSDLISRSALIESIKQRMKLHEKDAENMADENFQCDSEELFLRLADEGQAIIEMIEEQPTVKPVRGEWVYWKEQCEYCMNRNACPYPENQESMEALKQWEKENKFWGSLKLICDYYVLDKDKYYLDNPPECNAEG